MNGIISQKSSDEACEAYGCQAKAITEIKMNVGNHGTISVNICKDCMNRFKGDI